MTTVFLVIAIAGFVLALNANQPVPLPVLGIPSFFAGWLTTELAPHHLIAHVVVVAIFVALGAVSGPAGVVALGLAVITAVLLVRLIVISQRAKGVVEDALCAGLGEGYEDAIEVDRRSRYDLRVPWRQLVLPFWMRHPDVVKVKNLPYGPHGRRNQLDVLHHRDRPSGAPVLLHVHGGAWVIGDKEQQGLPLMLHMASRGWVCVTANYRLSPRATWPEHLIDAKRALAWVKEHIAEYGGDPEFVAVTGGSAGGHLASMVALTQNDPVYQPEFASADTSVRACLSYYGVYDFTDTTPMRSTSKFQRLLLEPIVMKKSYAEHSDAYRDASPLFQVGPDAPPFFVIHGRSDTLVPVVQARAFVDRLRAVSRSPVVYAELPGAQHAFEVFPSIRTAHVVNGAERFLDFTYTAYVVGRHASESSRSSEI